MCLWPAEDSVAPRLTTESLKEGLDGLAVDLLVNVGSVNGAHHLLALRHALGEVLRVYRDDGSLGRQDAEGELSQDGAATCQCLQGVSANSSPD